MNGRRAADERKERVRLRLLLPLALYDGVLRIGFPTSHYVEVKRLT